MPVHLLQCYQGTLEPTTMRSVLILCPSYYFCRNWFSSIFHSRSDLYFFFASPLLDIFKPALSCRSLIHRLLVPDRAWMEAFPKGYMNYQKSDRRRAIFLQRMWQCQLSSGIDQRRQLPQDFLKFYCHFRLMDSKWHTKKAVLQELGRVIVCPQGIIKSYSSLAPVLLLASILLWPSMLVAEALQWPGPASTLLLA